MTDGFSDASLAHIQDQIRENMVMTNDVEQYSRRLNIRIYGIIPKENESFDETVLSVIRDNLHLDCDPSEIESAHPLPSRPNPSLTNSHSTRSSFIVRFRRNQKRLEVLKNRRQLKGSGISVTEDLTTMNSQLLTRLHNDARIQSSWSWNGRIFAIAKSSGKKISIKPFSDLDKLLSNFAD